MFENENTYGNFGNTANDRITINSLIMFEVGGYQDEVLRPFEVTIDNSNLNKLNHMINEKFNANSNVSGTINGIDIAMNTPTILTPVAAPIGIVGINNGFGENRFIFILEVSAYINGIEKIHFIQGYTDFSDPSRTGKIDPRLNFNINSFTTVIRTKQPNGGTFDVIQETDNFLSSTVPNSSMPLGSPNSLEMQQFSVRPIDVYNGIQTAYIGNTEANDLGLSQNTLMDSRVQLNNTPKASNRSNNVGSDYVANLINAQTTAKNLTEIGSSSEDLFSAAKSVSAETPLINNKVLATLGLMTNGDGSIPKSFTYGNLVNIDNSVEQKTNMQLKTEVRNVTMVDPMNSQAWTDTSIETVMATIISNSIPSIMLKNLVTKLEFSATNKTMNGNPETVINSAKSMVNGDMRQYYDKIINTVNYSLMNELSHNGLMLVEIHVRCNVYLDTSISISVNDGNFTDYTSTTFCDSLSSPVVTTGSNNFYGMVNDFEVILNQFDTGI